MVDEMKSYRIVEISKKLTITEVYDSIMSYPFSDSSGFSVNKRRKDLIEASHLFKKRISKKIRDIYGNEEEISYFDYVKTNFSVININQRLYILVVEPPRETKVFNYDLKKSLPKFTSFRNISVNPILFYERLLNSKFSPTINEIDLANVNINNRGLGRFIFTSDQDIFKEAMSFVSNKDFCIRSMLISVELETIACKCRVSSTGLISMSSYNQDLIEFYVSSS